MASLSRQSAAEILVMDCSDRDPRASLAERFPAVGFRHFDTKLSIPQLRREGIRASKGEVVALTESWMEPGGGWVEALRVTHRKHADVPVVGGPIAFPCDGAAVTRLAWADYFSEYGEHVPDEADGPKVVSAERISGANCSYKRWALEECSDLVDRAAWEPVIHDRLRARGHELKRAAAAWVCYRRPARLGELLRQRFSYGRAHGAELAAGRSGVERLARGAAAPLVPWVLLWRLWRGLPPTPSLRGRLWASSGWVLALNTPWALGEAAGSWFGRSEGAAAVQDAFD